MNSRSSYRSSKPTVTNLIHSCLFTVNRSVVRRGIHILSPYPQHWSALTNCAKLRQSGFGGRRAILIFSYEGAAWPLEPPVEQGDLFVQEVA